MFRAALERGRGLPWFEITEPGKKLTEEG